MKKKFLKIRQSEAILVILLVLLSVAYFQLASEPPQKEPYFPDKEGKLQEVARKYYNRCIAAAVFRGEDPNIEVLQSCKESGDIWCASLGYLPGGLMPLEIINPLYKEDDGHRCFSLLYDQIWVIAHKVSQSTPENPYIDDFGPLQ